MNSYWDDERKATAALSAICGPANPGLAELIAAHGAEEIYRQLLADESEHSDWSRKARSLDLVELVKVAQSCNMRLVLPTDDEWPKKLSQLDAIEPLNGMSGIPIGLWVRGHLNLVEVCEKASAVAIVGARAATAYGELAANDLAAGLAHRFAVVSGGAYGIDAAAHRGALGSGGVTIAVMAGGLDSWYPRGNCRLLDSIVDKGLAISELPPGAHPTKPGFLMRNRLIAALSSGSVVVEASRRSGALNTASWTTRLGRILMAVPGPINSALSESPHRLIRDQEASLVSSVEDVKALLAPLGETIQAEDSHSKEHRVLDDLPDDLLAVHEAMPGRGLIDIERLSAKLGYSVKDCASALIQLEMRDLVEESAPGQWHLVRHKSS